MVIGPEVFNLLTSSFPSRIFLHEHLAFGHLGYHLCGLASPELFLRRVLAECLPFL